MLTFSKMHGIDPVLHPVSSGTGSLLGYHGLRIPSPGQKG